MLHRLLVLSCGLQLLVFGGCQTLRGFGSDSDASERQLSLAFVVADLKLHLRDDTYRSSRHIDSRGRNVFEVSLWRLDRMKRLRAAPDAAPTTDNAEIVIQYARARALERLRRYEEAAAAYAVVAGTGSVLADPAAEAVAVMERFTEPAGPTQGGDGALDDELRLLEERVAWWRKLAWQHRGTSWESLAREESEAWETLLVETLARYRSIDAAIEQCQRLIERHDQSKLHAKHLIRLGDLHAEAARREFLRYRTQRGAFDAAAYDGNLERAFAAYELAGEERRPVLRKEAEKKIEALLAYHQGVSVDVP